jgi:hypothetical protein
MGWGMGVRDYQSKVFRTAALYNPEDSLNALKIIKMKLNKFHTDSLAT